MTEGMAISERTPAQPPPAGQSLDAGLAGLALVAGYYRIAADPVQLRHQLALTGRLSERRGPRARRQPAGAQVAHSAAGRGQAAARAPAIPRSSRLKDGGFGVLGVGPSKGRVRLIDPIAAHDAGSGARGGARRSASGEVVLVTRRLGGAGVDPNTFGFRWFLPSILRYRKPLDAGGRSPRCSCSCSRLATPIFFQLVVDKVLVHKGLSTLVVLIIGMVTLGLFESVLQFLRTYTLSHTTNRIDVELGRRLFHHLFRLPLVLFRDARRRARRWRACANSRRSAAS